MANGHGGKRPGAGRKSDYFREKCRDMLRSKDALKFIDEVVRGVKIEPHVSDGGVVYTEPGVMARTKMLEFLRETGEGKPASVLDMGDGDHVFLGVIRIPQKDLGKAGKVEDGKN